MAQNYNFSSSEEFGESQGFNNFLKAQGSDDEDAILSVPKSKLQTSNPYGKSTGVGAGASKSQTAYGGKGAMYGASGGYGSGGGYSAGGGHAGASSGFGAASNYGVGGGYSAPVKQSATTYGSYGGYAKSGQSGGGYSGAGYSGGGYSGGGYSGSGYSGSGYTGGGFSGTGPKAGLGSGFGAKGGYSNFGAPSYAKGMDEYDDDYDEELDEELENGIDFEDKPAGGYELDLNSVKKRKEQQKKLKEEKKAGKNLKGKKDGPISLDFAQATGLQEEDDENDKTHSNRSDGDDGGQKGKPGGAKNKPFKSLNDVELVSSKVTKKDDKKASGGSGYDYSEVKKILDVKKKSGESKKSESKKIISEEYEESESKTGRKTDESYRFKKSEERESVDEDIDLDKVELPKQEVYDTAMMTNKLAESQSVDETAIKNAYKPSNESKAKFNADPKKDLRESRDSENYYADDFEHSASMKEGSRFERSHDLRSEDSSHILSAKKDSQAVQEPQKGSSVVKTQQLTSALSFGVPKTVTSAMVTKADGKTSDLKNYALEGALGEERRERLKVEAKLQVEAESHANLKKLFQEKEIEYLKMQARIESWTKEIESVRAEGKELRQKNATYQVEVEELLKQIDVMEVKMKEYEAEKKIMQTEMDEKTRLLRERKDFFEKTAQTRAVSLMRTELERDKELYLQQIESLKIANDDKDSLIKQLQDEVNEFKTDYRQKVTNDDEVRRLKQEIMDLELKLRAKDKGISSESKDHVIETRDSHHETAKTTAVGKRSASVRGKVVQASPEKAGSKVDMHEFLIQGYEKEIQRLLDENKHHKKQVEELNERLYDQNKKVNEIQTRLAHDSGNYILTDKELSVEASKFIGKDHLINKNELKEAQAKILKLQDEVHLKQAVYQDKEIELKHEIDRLRKKTLELEAKLGGVDMQEIKKDNEQFKKLQQAADEAKLKYETEIKDLRAKLTWYIQNQESIVGKQEALKEKDELIKNLQDDITKILNDPTTNLDAKTQHFTRLMNNDKRRIKQLELQIQELEDSLKKRNPTAYDKQAKEKEESQEVKELREKVKVLEKQKVDKEAEYETKLNDLRVQYDKMKLNYEQKIGTGKPVKGSSDDDPTVLKKRIKDLEKEIEDAKAYYLKKAKNVKETVKTAGAKERPGTAKLQTQTQEVQQIEFSATGIPTATTAGLTSSEKLNIANNLLRLPKSYLVLFMAEFRDTKTKILQNLGVESVVLKELNVFNDKMLKVYRTAGNIDDPTINEGLKALEKIIKTEGREKFTELKNKLDELTDEINDYVWCRIKNSIPIEEAPQNANKENNALVNNFMKDESGNAQPEVNKDKEIGELKLQLDRIKKEFAKVREEKLALEHIVQNTPKNPRALDFATLEKKLDIMEKNYRQSELEVKNAFKNIFFKDGGGIREEDVINLKNEYEREINYYKSLLENKNREIAQFRKEISFILGNLETIKETNR